MEPGPGGERREFSVLTGRGRGSGSIPCSVRDGAELGTSSQRLPSPSR